MKIAADAAAGMGGAIAGADGGIPLTTGMKAHVLHKLIGRPRWRAEEELPQREIFLSHIPLPVLQRIFHVGPTNLLLEGRRHINPEKAERLEAYCSEAIDTRSYDWELKAYWSER